MKNAVLLVAIVIAPFCCFGQYKYSETNKTRPSNFYTIRLLINSKNSMPMFVLKILKQSGWEIVSDNTTSKLRNILLGYSYNSDCTALLAFDNETFCLRYTSPYNTDDDVRMYKNAVHYLLSHNCDVKTQKENDHVSEWYQKISTEENVMIMITKYLDRYGDVSKIQYDIFNAEGI